MGVAFFLSRRRNTQSLVVNAIAVVDKVDLVETVLRNCLFICDLSVH